MLSRAKALLEVLRDSYLKGKFVNDGMVVHRGFKFFSSCSINDNIKMQTPKLTEKFISIHGFSTTAVYPNEHHVKLLEFIIGKLTTLDKAKTFLEVLTDDDLLFEFITERGILYKGYIFRSNVGVCHNIDLLDDDIALSYINAYGLDRSVRFPCNKDVQEYVRQIYSHSLYPSSDRVQFLQYIVTALQ